MSRPLAADDVVLTPRVLENAPLLLDTGADAPASITRGYVLDPQERKIVREALRRGASRDQLAELVYRHRFRRKPEPPLLDEGHDFLGGLYDAWPMAGSPQEREQQRMEQVYEEISPEIEGYRAEMADEFNGLPAHVRASFSNSLDTYLEIRPGYYNAGYSDPAGAVFSQIVGGVRLLGHPVIGGLHREFVDRLARLEDTLRGWDPGLVEQVRAEMGRKASVGGFVPRVIAGTGVLSNHAFGMAIDIDPAWNPHIVNRDVIEVLNWVVRDLGFNFGERFVERSAVVLDRDRLAQTRILASQASDRVRDWLRQHLPAYLEVREEVRAATALLRTKRRGTEEHAQALAALEEAKAKISGSQELWRLQILDAHHSRELAGWAERGIQTIPLYLAAALGELGFTWGQDYQKSKDSMHFELEARRHIRADTPRKNGFEDLLERE